MEKKEKLSDSQLDKLSLSTGEKLKKQKKVTICIMPDKNDGENAKYVCWINGYRYIYPKGEYIEVPEDVATMIAQNARVLKQAKKLEAKFEKGVEVS